VRPRLGIAELERWVAHGASWRAVEVTDDHAIVELCSCHGEAVDRLESRDPGVIAFVRAQAADD
jgi:hypothetical protein